MSIETGVQADQEQSGHDDVSQRDCPVDTGFDEFERPYAQAKYLQEHDPLACPGLQHPYSPSDDGRGEGHYQRYPTCRASENCGTAHDDWTPRCQESCKQG